MDNFYLTDEDIHGLEEDEIEMVLRNRLNKANEKIKELEEIIEQAHEILSDANA